MSDALYENGRKISLVSLTIPQYLQTMLGVMIGSINTFMLSNYSQVAVAGVGIADQLLSIICTFINIISAGASVIMSIRIGAKQKETAEEIAGMGVIMLALVAIPVTLIMTMFSAQLLRLMNVDAEGMKYALSYFRIRSLFIALNFFFTYFMGRLLCTGYIKYTLISGTVSGVLNVIISYFVIFKPEFMPFKGVIGIAASNVISQGVGLLIALSLYLYSGYKIRFNKNIKYSLQIFRIGIPASVSSISYMVSQTMITAIIASMGMMMVTARVYLLNITSYISMLSYSTGTAASILMGRYKGSMDYEGADRTYKKSVRFAVMVNVTLALIIFLMRVPLISIFTDVKEIIALATPVLLIEIFVEIARPINNISDQSLNAVGDVVFTPTVAIVSCWVFGVGLSYFLGVKMGYMLVGCWLASAFDEGFRAIAYSIRWRMGKWKNFNI